MNRPLAVTVWFGQVVVVCRGVMCRFAENDSSVVVANLAVCVALWWEGVNWQWIVWLNVSGVVTAIVLGAMEILFWMWKWLVMLCW